MSNYSKTTDFEAKDSLPTGDSGKIIRGAEFETEFDAISTAIATKADTAGPTFTGTLTFETISDGTIAVTAFVDEDDMSSDSATLVPTQQSVKAYVDSQVTAQDLDFQADTGGALSIDLDSETLTFTGGTGIDTSGSGNAVTFAIDSTVATLTGTQTLTNKTLTSPDVNTPDIDGGTIDGTVIGGTTPAAVSATTVSATGNIAVGGTVDGRDVATDGTKLDTVETNADVTDTANVTAAGALMDSELTSEASVKALNQGVATTDSPTFAGVTVNGNVEFDGLSGTGSVTVTDILDQDDMSGNSATALATQQSIKAYVDSQVATADTLAEVLANGNTTGGTDIAIGTGDDITFADNSKAIFGAGSDLQIYHDSSNSYINEVGTGNLFINADNIRLRDTSGNPYFLGNSGAETRLYYAGGTKLATTSTGVNVTGTVTADSLTVDNSGTAISITNGDGLTQLGKFAGEASDGFVIEGKANNNLTLRTKANTAGEGIKFQDSAGDNMMFIDGTTGDISFYEDTGTTAKLEWLASDENLKFADNSKAIFGAGSDLQIYSDGGSGIIQQVASGVLLLKGQDFYVQNDAGSNYIRAEGSAQVDLYYGGVKKFETTSTGIDVTGSISADALTVDKEGTDHLKITDTSSSNALTVGIGNTVGTVAIDPTDSVALSKLDFSIDGNTAIRIAEGGDISFYEDTGTTAKFHWSAADEALGIGTSSISTSKLHVQGTTGTASAVRAESTAADSDAYYIADNDASVWTWGIDGGNNDAWTLSNAFGLGTPKLTVKTGGNVGINDSAPDNKLQISDSSIGTDSTANDNNFIKLTNKDANTVNEVWGLGFSTESSGTDYLGGFVQALGDYTSNFNTSLIFGTRGTSGNATERMRIDSNGVISVKGDGSSATEIDSNTVSSVVYQDLGGFTGTPSVARGIRFFGNNASGSKTERMRINSSGHLLVGTTDAGVYDDATDEGGHNLLANGQYFNSTASEINMILNRQNSDGDIIQFRRDGTTTVGSIGSNSGFFYIGGTSGNDAFLSFGADGVRPATSAGAARDAAIDLGGSTNRFKNLYLSGGVSFDDNPTAVTGNVSSKTLDDYEEGTFTATLTPGTSGSIILLSTEDKLAYTKVGRLVTVTGRLRVSSVSSPVGTLVNLTSLPFVIASDSENCFQPGCSNIFTTDGSNTFSSMPCTGAEGGSTLFLYGLTVADIDNLYRFEFSFSYFTT